VERANDWMLFDLQNDDRQQEATVRTLLERPREARLFSTMIDIGWMYGQSGLPSDSDEEAMYELERRIVELMSGNGNSMLVQVRTGFGERNWIFYVASPRRFMARFNELLQDGGDYPLKIEHFKDREWLAFLAIVQPLKRRVVA
jgi:hypothetical protein